MSTYLGAQQAHALIGRYRDFGRRERWGRERFATYQPPIYGQQPGVTYATPPPVTVDPAWADPNHPHHHHWRERERRRREWERLHPGIPFVGAEALVGAWNQIIGPSGGSGPNNPLSRGPYGDPHGSHPHVGAVPNPMMAAAEAYGIAPRAVMVPYPTAEQAQRQTLPMNTGGAVVTTTVAALITSRPQRQAFRPERVFVSQASSPSSTLGAGGAADWLINDISIGNRSQYVQAGSLPGDIFQSTAIDSYVTFETAQTAMDVTMSVTYNGTGTTGEVNGLPFWGSIHGTAAV